MFYIYVWLVSDYNLEIQISREQKMSNCPWRHTWPCAVPSFYNNVLPFTSLSICWNYFRFINRSLCVVRKVNTFCSIFFRNRTADPYIKSNMICKIRNKVQFWVHFLKLPAPTPYPLLLGFSFISCVVSKWGHIAI